MYDVLKILHILSVIGWLGSSVVAVLWKVTADRSADSTAGGMQARSGGAEYVSPAK